MKNNFWLIQFLIKKKWVWLVGTIIVLYFMLLPYQKSLLLYSGEYSDVRKMFWDVACLYHGILLVTFVFQGMSQLMNTEIGEMTKMFVKAGKYVAIGFMLAYELIALPSYVWYIKVTLGDMSQLSRLFFSSYAGYSCLREL